MDKIYYLSDPTTEKIVHYLRSRRNFRPFNFVPVFQDDIITTNKGYLRSVKNANEGKAVLIWGSGDNHHISYFFSPEEDYFKSIDDTHDDLQDWYKRLHCANHNTALIRTDKHLKGLEVLGVTRRFSKSPEELIEDYDLKNLELIKVRSDLKSAISGQAVHKSIDIDVVENYPCSSELRRGVWTMDEIKQAFEDTMKKNDVIRFDLGGLRLKKPQEKLSRDEFQGIMAYEDLIKIYLDHNTSMV